MQQPIQQLNDDIKVRESTLTTIEAMIPHALCAVMGGLLSPCEAARLLANEIQAGLIVETQNG